MKTADPGLPAHRDAVPPIPAGGPACPRRGGRPVRTVWRVLAAALAVSLCGCAGGVALKRSFNDYAAVYADISNRQLLLNLARMANTHPPRFLQLGLINATFTLGASASANVGQTSTDGLPLALGGAQEGPVTLLSRATTWGANGSLTFTETPTFTFTPLAGPEFAKGFLAEVPAKIFFSLLDQGEPIDQLLRALAQSVEYTDPVTGKPVLLVNIPDPDWPERYIQFLRVAGICLELQRRQLLRVQTSAATVPIAGLVFDTPTLEDALKVTEKGLVLVPAAGQPGKVSLASVASSTSLHVSPDATSIWAEISRLPYFQLPNITNPSGALPTPRTGTIETGSPGLTIRLRSFFEVLTWVSREQSAFEILTRRPGFLEELPPSQRQPILQLVWDGVKEPLETPVAAISYGDRVYAITDRRGQTWNRDIFTLLSYVESQISLDPKSLPVQQLIQVR